MDTIKKRKNLINEIDFEVIPSFPKEFYLDLTSFCNHKCVFCSNPKIKTKATMDHDFVFHILDEAYQNGARELGIYATGESFLVKNLAEYIAYAKNIGYEYVFITTNGVLVNEKIGKPVLDAGLDSIKFSISAGRKETYKKIQGVDDFDLVIDNLKWVHAYRNKSGLDYRIYVTMVYTNETAEEVSILQDAVLPYADEWDPHPLNNQCGNMPENNEIGYIEANNPRGRGKRDVCFQPFKGFMVTPEGLMSACVLDYSKDLIVADLHKVSMKEAWENKIYKKFREDHMAQSVEGTICYNCINNTNKPVDPLIAGYRPEYK